MATAGLSETPTAAAMQAKVHNAVAGQRIEPASTLGPNSQQFGLADSGRSDSEAHALNAWLAYRYQYYLWMQTQFQNHLVRNMAGAQLWMSQAGMPTAPGINLFPTFYGALPQSFAGTVIQQVPLAAPPVIPGVVAPNPFPPRADVPAAANVQQAAAPVANNNDNGPQVLNVQGNADAVEWDGDILDILFTVVKAVTLIMLLSYSPSAMRFASVMGAFLVLRALRRRWNLRRAPANAAPAAAAAAPPAQPPAADPPAAPAAAAVGGGNANNNFAGLVDEGDAGDEHDDDDASSDSDDAERPLLPPTTTAVTPAVNSAVEAPPAVPQSLLTRVRVVGERTMQFVAGFIQSILPEAPN